MNRKAKQIARVLTTPLEIELSEPFGIASGVQHRADNVLVRVELGDGSSGLGEAAPFPAVNGETQARVLDALERFEARWLGSAAGRWRERCHEVRELLDQTPSAACALECALLDAWLRSHRVSMWEFFGAREVELESDLTIPTGTVEQAAPAARRARQAGFRTLKVKVGAGSLDDDARRLREIAAAAPDAGLLLDANAALSADQALELLKSMGSDKARVRLFEQPTEKHDLEAMKKVLVDGGVSVAADESATSARDVVAIAKSGAASAINVKISKSGLVGALDMIHLAKGHGLDLMIGGMVESKLCMCVSACLAGGLGGFTWVDLDTPLFMKDAPFVGGYEQDGDRLRLSKIDRGHGVRVR